MVTGIVSDEIFLRHETGPNHPESPARLRAITRHLRSEGLFDELTRIELPPQPRADLDDCIRTAHRPLHLERLQRAIPAAGLFGLDADTWVSPGSLIAARMAVEGVLDAVDAVMAGRVNNAFCAVRPPGHHAESGRAMGFCLFNNVAIAARYAQRRHGIARVLIVDWDVHHGNGTQEIFYTDPSVFYFSVHQSPLYPGSGRRDEIGAGPGEGYTMNRPLPPGSGDAEYGALFETDLDRAVRGFQPGLILISAGFDAHRDDPLAGMDLTADGFAALTARVRVWADRYAAGRIIACLEGGYHLEALPRSVAAHLGGLKQ